MDFQHSAGHLERVVSIRSCRNPPIQKMYGLMLFMEKLFHDSSKREAGSKQRRQIVRRTKTKPSSHFKEAPKSQKHHASSYTCENPDPTLSQRSQRLLFSKAMEMLTSPNCCSLLPPSDFHNIPAGHAHSRSDERRRSEMVRDGTQNTERRQNADDTAFHHRSAAHDKLLNLSKRPDLLTHCNINSTEIFPHQMSNDLRGLACSYHEVYHSRQRTAILEISPRQQPSLYPLQLQHISRPPTRQ